MFAKAAFALIPLACTLMTRGHSWSSGGGELLTDSQNPWFLENTKQVTYCVEIDEENFGIGIDAAREKIQAAFHYWQRQFRELTNGLTADAYGGDLDGDRDSDSDPSTRIRMDIKIASQNFVEVSCSSSHDMKFQLGTLTDMQKQFLKDPSLLAGIAVRTDYDRRLMKGQGFVYISPERGPLALKAASIKENRWQIEGHKRLEAVLIHELGHVFGLPHQEGLMKKSFVDSVIRRNHGVSDHPDAIQNFFVQTERNSIFRSLRYYNRSSSGPIWDIPEGSVVQIQKGNHFDLTYEYQGQSHTLGSIRLIQSNAAWSFMNRGLTIVLPAEQIVFESLSGKRNVRIDVLGIGSIIFNGGFYDTNNQFKRGITLTMEPDLMWATSVYPNGEIALNFMLLTNIPGELNAEAVLSRDGAEKPNSLAAFPYQF